MRQSLIGHTIGLSDTKWVGLCCAPLMLLLLLLSVSTCADDAIIDEPHMRGTFEHMSNHTEYYCMRLYTVWETNSYTNSTTHQLP
jgi:hypothetical protein